MTGELAQPAVVLSEQPHLARPKAIWEPVARQYANPGGTLTSSMVDCAVRVAFAAAAQTPMRQLLDDFSPCERGYLEWYAAHADQPQQDGMPVVVEAGAGVGFHALRMARAGLKVTAREINPELVRALQARLEQPEYESVARVLRCEAGSGFAGVSVQGAEAHLRCDRLLCYLSEDERRALFEDARRVAGMRTFALRTYDRVQGWNQYEPLAPVRWLTDLPELMALARAAGLTVARASYRVEGFDRIVNSDIYGQHGDPIDAQAFCDALAQDVDRAERHPALLGVQALTSVVMQRKH
ncbi:MAG TPA: class I SAM-dependent methyltransferase [Ramlibacter sp.]|nr:class I SAM-dependent methyltransferase [Ramlibacter sp.]